MFEWCERKHFDSPILKENKLAGEDIMRSFFNRHKNVGKVIIIRQVVLYLLDFLYI